MSPRPRRNHDVEDFLGDDPRPGRGTPSDSRAGQKKSAKAEAKASRAADKQDRRAKVQKRREAQRRSDARASSSRRKSEKLANEFFGEEVIEAPSEGAEVYRSASRKAKFHRGLIKSTVFVVAPLSLAANVAILGAFMAQEEEETDLAQTTSERRPLAVTTVEEYLAGGEDGLPPLPGVELMNWDHAELTYDAQAVLEEADLSSDDLAEEMPQAVSYENHHLSLRSTEGTFYTAEVQVAFSDVAGAWVTSDPSITAEVPASARDGASDEPFPGMTETQASESVVDAAQSWAEAYYSGSPSMLKQSVGDGRDDTGYMPMPLAEEVEADVSSAAIADGAELVGDDEDLPTRVVARVEAEVSWPQPDPDDDDQHPMDGFNDAAELDDDGSLTDPGAVDPADGGGSDASTITPQAPVFDAEENLVTIPEVDGIAYDPAPGEHEVEDDGLEVTAEPEDGVEFTEGATTEWQFDTDDAVSDDEADPHLATVSYDVLIVDAHTATPRIVAWGAPGQGRDLEDFDNAIKGRVLEDADQQ